MDHCCNGIAELRDEYQWGRQRSTELMPKSCLLGEIQGTSKMLRSRYNGGNPRNALLSIPQNHQNHPAFIQRQNLSYSAFQLDIW